MVKKLVKNDKQYWEFIRELRNHPDVKTGFIEQEHIDKFDHALYMQRLGSSFYICLIDETPAGYVGVIQNDIRVATIGFSDIENDKLPRRALGSDGLLPFIAFNNRNEFHVNNYKVVHGSLYSI